LIDMLRVLNKVLDDAQDRDRARDKDRDRSEAGAAAPPAPPRRITRIAAAWPWYETGLGELGRRGLDLLRVFVWFTWRQIGVRYRQPLRGIAWAALIPVLTMLTFSFVFSKLGGLPAEGFPYPVFVLSGLVTWLFFARAITAGSFGATVSGAIVTKVWFPRMVLPLSAVVAGFVDYGVSLAVLLAMMTAYGLAPGPALATLPVFILLAAMLGFALSLWLSALNALYRDIGLTIPIVLQAWMLMTPVVYPAALVPADWAWILHYNPMTALVEGARWAVLPTATPPHLRSLAIPTGVIAVLLLGGIVTFKRVDAILADRM
jgi:lipopolysaccharide transport system permease protein